MIYVDRVDGFSTKFYLVFCINSVWVLWNEDFFCDNRWVMNDFKLKIWIDGNAVILIMNDDI